MSKSNQNIPERRGGLIGCLARLVRSFLYRRGYVVIHRGEITIMEQDAQSYYRHMKSPMLDNERDRGYFNGLADYSSKKAMRFRDLYLPNTEVSHGVRHERN